MSDELVAIFKKFPPGYCYPVKVRVSPYMDGATRPVMSGDVLHVSPAMFDLLKNADEQEMEHLLRNLFPIDIPGICDLTMQPNFPWSTR